MCFDRGVAQKDTGGHPTSVLSPTLALQFLYAMLCPSSYFVSRAGKGIDCALAALCPSGLLFSHVLFILQVTTLCRWSISTSRGSWDITSSKHTFHLSWLSCCHKSLSGSIRSLSRLVQSQVCHLDCEFNQMHLARILCVHV